jgi:uncharacterized protein YkwD
MKVKILLLFISLLLISCSKSQDQEIYPQYSYNFSKEERDVMHVTNVYRNSIELDTLKSNQHIAYLCYEHNDYMIVQDTITHDYFCERSDNIIKTLNADNVGEVLAYNYTSPQSVLNAWINSPLHRNIIEGNFTHFGVSIKQDSNGRKYYTFIFAKI